MRSPAELPERLRSKRAEIEESLLARTRSVADPSQVGDADYVHGLSEAVRAALGHAIEALDRPSVDAEEPLPPQLAAQARLAARRGVGLEIVTRRYVAGHALLCQFILREAGDASASSLQSALRTEAMLLDRVIAEVSDAYGRELHRGPRTAARRRAELVKALLAGEAHNATELGYDLDLWHLGIVAAGPEAEAKMRQLAADLDRRLLVVRSGGEELWAWLGGHRKLCAREAAERARASFPPGLALAIGEPGRGISAWRLTHRQAKLALPIARRGPEPVVAYSDVALLASALGDELLACSLAQLYLAPLEAERDGGKMLRETLHAYFETGRSLSAAAAALGVSRQTITRRIAAAERRIGRRLESCAAEIETALRVHQLDQIEQSTAGRRTAPVAMDQMSHR